MKSRRDHIELVAEKETTELLSDIRSFNKNKVSDTLDRVGSIKSDVRDGTFKHPARYSPIELKEYYPVNPEAGTNTTTVINVSALGALALVVDAQPAVDRVHEVQYIRAECNAPFAANRQLIVDLWDGANFVTIYDSGIAALTGAEDGLVHPTDEFTVAATYAGTRNSFDVWNGTYLRFTAVGLVAVETITLYTHWKVKDAGGLRT